MVAKIVNTEAVGCTDHSARRTPPPGKGVPKQWLPARSHQENGVRFGGTNVDRCASSASKTTVGSVTRRLPASVLGGHNTPLANDLLGLNFECDLPADEIDRTAAQSK